jgi:hypothetical protein
MAATVVKADVANPATIVPAVERTDVVLLGGCRIGATPTGTG